MSNMDEYLEFAKDLAQEAGKIMLRYFLAVDINTIMKEDDTPLTVADTAINELVIKMVKKEYPSHGVLGEEKSYEAERDLLWVLDPIDGTVPYSIGIPVSTFTVALVDKKDGQAKVGVIFDPHLNKLYTAIKGGGAKLNDKPIKVADKKTLAFNYVSLLGFRHIKLGPVFDELYNNEARCISLISQAYSAAKVASGELVGSIFAYGSPWDSAASSLIVTEAGGIVTDLNGNPRRYDEFADGCILSCNQSIHDKLVEIVGHADYRD